VFTCTRKSTRIVNIMYGQKSLIGFHLIQEAVFAVLQRLHITDGVVHCLLQISFLLGFITAQIFDRIL